MVKDGTSYYFHRNLQGDVVGVYDSAGTKVVAFKYDAFGRCTVSGDESLADCCKIRYRGYYYDTETGLYWVQTRYLNPDWCRWISPDGIGYLDLEIADGVNLYAYCINDPVNYIDPSGHFIITLIGCIVGAAIGFGVAAYKYYKDDGKVFNGSVEWYDYLGATLLGGIMMFAKGNGPRMGHNQYEKKQWEEAMRRLNISNKDTMQRLHHKLHKYEYQNTLEGLIKVLKEIMARLGM